MFLNRIVASQRPATIKMADGNIYVVTHLECNESLSDGLSMFVSVCSHEEIDESVTGKALQVTFKHNGNVRNYNAVTISLTITGYDQTRHIFFYDIVARDLLALLEFRQQRRIFQNITTRKILDDIFLESNLSSLIKFSLISKSDRKNIFCTQMDETDLTFVRRLMAKEGWHYHMDHSTDAPSIIIADSNQAFEKLPDVQISWLKKNQHLENLRQTTCLGTSKIRLIDYSLENSQVIQSDDRYSIKKHSSLSFNSVIYGAGYQNKNDIQNAVKLHMESIDNKNDILSATSNISTVSVGKSFQLIEHPLEKINQEYIVTSVIHSIESSENGNDVKYNNSLQCRPALIPFRPPIPTRNQVYGLHTATVTGPAGDEIYSDKIGRIKVQFHWDNEGRRNENSSCWLPVLQTMAGKGFGLQFLPRVGHLVLVQYIEGNPDNPVVVGSLYNQENNIPWPSATTSGIRTHTTPQGNSRQGNELRFEDQKNNESIFVHAEKDLLVESNNDFICTVKGKKISRVDKNIQLVAKEAIEVSADKTLTLNSKENMSAQSEKDINIQAGGNGKFSAKSVVSLSGETIEITGTSKIKLNVGGSKIEISNEGINLSATKISIASLGTAEVTGTTVTIEGKAKTDIKGVVVTVDGSAMTEVKAAALVKIQGAITKIN